MLVDALPQHKVEGQVNRLVKEVRELETQQAEEVDKLLSKVAKEVVEAAKEVDKVAKEVVKVAKEVVKVVKEVVKSRCLFIQGVSGMSPKDYDGKGGAIVYTRWIEKMESVHDMSRCKDNQKVKYTASSFISKVLMREEFFPNNEMEAEFWCHTMVGAGHVVYTDQFHELARLVPHLVIPENKRIERLLIPIE
ncbi:hypothetical protein Tco_0189367 [Tanacetum coccineum]